MLTPASVLQEAANTLQRRFANKPEEVWLQSAMYPSCEPAGPAWHCFSCMLHCMLAGTPRPQTSVCSQPSLLRARTASS